MTSYTARYAPVNVRSATLAWFAGLALLGSPLAPAAEPAAAQTGASGKLIIFAAASLNRPFTKLEKLYEERHPGTDVLIECSGSMVAIRKVTDLKRDADIVACADYRLIEKHLLPASAKWHALFARNRVVIAYTDKSKFRNEINADNWYDILLRKGVNYGYSDPSMAPVGTYTLVLWKLADLKYADKLQGRSIYADMKANCPPQFIRPHCNELLPLIESLAVDYIFEFDSVSRQHNLQVLQLPDELNQGNVTLADWYAKVSVDVPTSTRGETETRVGQPIVYSTTILAGAPNPQGAAEFLALLFGPEGQGIMKADFHEMIVPPMCTDLNAAPESLRPLMKDVVK